MALDPVSWMIGGPDKDTPGPKHSAEIVRQAHHDATGGAEGISTVGALKVAAMPTPGAKVRVLPGGGIVLNRYEQGNGQSYGVRNATQSEVPITATGSGGGRTDLVVIRVLDPQYEGQYPANPEEFDFTRLEVIEGVPAGTKTFRELNRNYPAIELAKVTLPKSTATVTAAMITDLREVAQPKVLDVWRPRPLAAPDVETLTASGEVGEYFPNAGGTQYIDIPEWATRMQVRAEWLQVRYGAGNAYGWCWLEWGPYKAPSERERKSQAFQWDTPAADNASRSNWVAVDDLYIPVALRGTTQLFVQKARRIGGVTNSVSLDAVSGVSLQVRFLQVADPSTS
ncbi:hypothetical protein ACTXOR_08630 [Arthrobacter rhombi]|uniref:hypothetical protein n=1 Tax=Arthrobacter rhombi TaxID=71253 RepID=UPI003FD54A1E